MLLLAGLLLPTREVAAQAAPKPGGANAVPVRKPKRHTQAPAPVVEVAQTPAPPPTLEQQAPAAPQVTYRDGQLTINSTNATLSQVLRSVQTQTGATIDIPPGAGSERVVANLGPGKPQAVLASLLNGSKFNYVILGESSNPGAVQKVILLSKSVSSGSSGGGTPSVTAQNNFRTPPPVAVEQPEDEYPQNEPEPENPSPLVPGQPGMPGAENLQPDVIQPGNRTPEQMLQELQRMQQQQQQMQQQLNPANQQPFNQQNPPQSSPFPGQPLTPRPQ